MRFGPVLAMAVLAALAAAALAQRFGGFNAGTRVPEREEAVAIIPPRAAEYHFIRLEYTDLPQYHRGFGFASRMGRGSGWWIVDWPAADTLFTRGVERLTRIDIGDPRHFRLTDPQLFDYPWIYATQADRWDLSGAEIARLREYLMRGGFLMTDDFWGPLGWELFGRTMNRVFPGRPIVDIDPSNSAMHVLYDIEAKDRTTIPGSRHLRRGYDGSITVQYPEGAVPAWRAIYDERGRMVISANFNTDIGDAWEFADVPYYPENMTALAYRYGINYIVYSMTH